MKPLDIHALRLGAAVADSHEYEGRFICIKSGPSMSAIFKSDKGLLVENESGAFLFESILQDTLIGEVAYIDTFRIAFKHILHAGPVFTIIMKNNVLPFDNFDRNIAGAYVWMTKEEAEAAGISERL